jgi:hypothetical protein
MLRSVLAIIVARTRAIFSSSSLFLVSFQDNGSVSSASSTSSAPYFVIRSSDSVPSVSSALHGGGSLPSPSPLSCHFRPPAILKTTFCVSWRYRLRDNFLNADLLFFKATSGGYTSSSKMGSILLNALCTATAAWFLPFHNRGGSDPSGRWLQGTMPVSGMPWGAPGGIAG